MAKGDSTTRYGNSNKFVPALQELFADSREIFLFWKIDWVVMYVRARVIVDFLTNG